MRSVIFAACVLLAFGSNAFAQAAVESVLTHALSTTMSAGAGKAIGQIGNQLAGTIGQQTSNAIHPVVTNVKPVVPRRRVARPVTPTTPISNAPTTNGGSMIASIQGETTLQPEARCSSQTEQATNSTQSGQKQNNCVAAKSSTSQDPNAYQSVIDLPAAK